MKSEQLTSNKMNQRNKYSINRGQAGEPAARNHCHGCRGLARDGVVGRFLEHLVRQAPVPVLLGVEPSIGVCIYWRLKISDRGIHGGALLITEAARAALPLPICYLLHGRVLGRGGRSVDGPVPI